MSFHYTGKFSQSLTLYEIGVHDKVNSFNARLYETYLSTRKYFDKKLLGQRG